MKASFPNASFIFLFECTENIRDLLNPSTSDLPVHENKERGVYVPLKEVIVGDVQNVLRAMEHGESNKAHKQ